MTAELWRQENEGTLLGTMRKQLDDGVATLHHITHATDAIKTATIPFQYVQMQRLFMVIFLYTIPCALVEAMGVLTVPVTMILTFGYVGLDKTGDSLEDPFGADLADLPLVACLRKMETSTRRIVDARFGVGVAEKFDLSSMLPDAGDDGEPDDDVNAVMPFVKSSAVMAFNGGSSGGGKDGRGGYQPIQGGGGSTDLLGMDANEV